MKFDDGMECPKEWELIWTFLNETAERYKKKKIAFKTICDITIILDRQKHYELVALFWKRCYKLAPIRFKKEVMNYNMKLTGFGKGGKHSKLV